MQHETALAHLTTTSSGPAALKLIHRYRPEVCPAGAAGSATIAYNALGMTKAKRLREQERERHIQRITRLLEQENTKVGDAMAILSRAVTTYEDQARLAMVLIEQSKFHTETLIAERRRLDDDRKAEHLEEISKSTAWATWAAAFVGLAAMIVALVGYLQHAR